MSKENYKEIAQLIASMPTTLPTLLFITLIVGIPSALESPPFDEYNIYAQAVFRALIPGFFVAILYCIAVTIARILYPRDIGSDDVGYGVAVAKMARANVIPDDEYHRYCVHEAGHILSFRLYETPPDSINAWVKRVESLPNGNVYAEYSDAPNSFCHLRSMMLTRLAGYCAEEVVLGKADLGSNSDLSAWEEHARKYLGSSVCSGYKWFTCPANVHEAEVNINTLHQLRTDLWEEMSEYLTANKSLLIEVAEDLKTNEILETEELMPYINRASGGVF